MKINFKNEGIELRDMSEGPVVGKEFSAATVDANLRNAAPKGVVSRILSAVASFFSEKYEARAVVAEANRLSVLDGEPTYTSFADLIDK